MPAVLDLSLEALIWVTLAAVIVGAPLLGWWLGQLAGPACHDIRTGVASALDEAVERRLNMVNRAPLAEPPQSFADHQAGFHSAAGA